MSGSRFPIVVPIPPLLELSDWLPSDKVVIWYSMDAPIQQGKWKVVRQCGKGQVFVLHNKCLFVQEIAEAIHRPNTVVHDSINNPRAYGSEKNQMAS